MNCCNIKATIKEFLNYRLPKAKNKKIGAVGEMLLNVNITISAISPSITQCEVEKVWNSPPEKYKTSTICCNIIILLFSSQSPYYTH